MLVVWGRRTSSNVQALMWCIGELGLAYKRHDVGHKFGGTDTEAFGRLNPNRSVPVLQDGSNSPLWETGAILRYLANRYAGEPFWPAELIARTEVDRWAEWAKINIAMGFTGPVFWRVVRMPASDCDPDAIRQAVLALEDKLAIAEARLASQPYLVGQALSLADIQFGHVLFRYFDIGVDRADLPNLAAYYARLTERPAYREHVMVSYDDLRA
ncbi:MAG: glutathione S-transferase family protein [Alphaproteobacteria bacterium]|nr:glutathione S-transferase family protein [Alphaproteobacteria bacterium]